MFLVSLVAPGPGHVLVVEAGVAHVDVTVHVRGPGDVLDPVPGLVVALAQSLANVPTPRSGIDLVPIQKSATGTRASLAVAAAQSLPSVPVPDLGLVPVPVVNQGRGMTPMLTMNQRKMLPLTTMTGDPVRDPQRHREVVLKRMPRCTHVVLPLRRTMLQMNECLSYIYLDSEL